MKLVALVGSTRKESLNLALVKTMEERYREKIEITVAKIDDLPYYNQDTEDNPSSAVLRLRKEIVSSDAVLIVTPEFNWSIPGVLKNALDWLSRADKELKGKTVMVQVHQQDKLDRYGHSNTYVKFYQALDFLHVYCLLLEMKFFSTMQVINLKRESLLINQH